MKSLIEKWEHQIKLWTSKSKFGDREFYRVDDHEDLWVTFVKLDAQNFAYLDDRTKVWEISNKTPLEVYKKLVEPIDAIAQEIYQIMQVWENTLVVVCLSYMNPISYLPKIEDDLEKIHFSGKLIFDLLGCNGDSENRFVEANVNCGMVDRKTMRVINRSNLDPNLLRILVSAQLKSINHEHIVG